MMQPIFAIAAITVAAVPLPVTAQQFVVNYQAPDGSVSTIDIGVRFPSRVQRLKPKIAMDQGSPVLHLDSKRGGKVASTVTGEKLIVWQLPAGSRQSKSATRATIRFGKPNRAITPNWWPRLHKPWSRRAVDKHSVTTTLLGWSARNIAATRSRIVAAAARAGLSTSKFGRSFAETTGGDLAFFTGTGKEMMVTFSRIGGRTGVVAHLTEVKQ